jgi:hypothetical protein
MTDLAKALAFATQCLKWTAPWSSQSSSGVFVNRTGGPEYFCIDSSADFQRVLQEFLGKRYLIQANRGTSSLFHWRVIVGWQDGTDRSKSFEHGVGVGEDLWDAIFDACVQAVGMFEKP